MLIIIVSIVIYAIIGFIFGCLCYNFVSVTDSAWTLGLLWGIVLPFMIVYALLSTVIKWFQMYWE